MRRLAVISMMALAFVACNRGHPVSVYVSDDFQLARGGDDGGLAYEKIAVFPFLSALHASEDPDGDAPRTMEKFFAPALDSRSDYRFIATNTLKYAVDREGWQGEYQKFLDTYARTDKPDTEFLSRLAASLQCDAFLIPVVDTWQKDEVDVLENASAATYVGATITILSGSGSPGTILFRAVDEDYEEGIRSETGDRTLVTSGSGIIRSDPGAKSYAAPPFEDVVPKVISALVSSLPAR